MLLYYYYSFYFVSILFGPEKAVINSCKAKFLNKAIKQNNPVFDSL